MFSGCVLSDVHAELQVVCSMHEDRQQETLSPNVLLCCGTRQEC